MYDFNTHSARSVADQVIKKAAEKGLYLTPMQVIKLVYLCHGWTLGLYGRPLINELVEAWKYGPVIRSLYGALKHFKANRIAPKPPLTVGPAPPFSQDEISIIQQVVDIYGNYSGPQLSQLTHEPGTPWSRHREQGLGYQPIKNDWIQEYFEQLANVPPNQPPSSQQHLGTQ